MARGLPQIEHLLRRAEFLGDATRLRVAAATVPRSMRPSMNPGVSTTRSNGAPASIFSLAIGVPPNWREYCSSPPKPSSVSSSTTRRIRRVASHATEYV